MIKQVLKFLEGIRTFFPINLLFSQVKYNLIVLFYWILLFGIINSSIGIGIGLPYLFLSPEYLGLSSYLAFLILGISIGGFIMAFHIYSYIQIGPKYPFIATLSRPFYKFSLNNSLLPLIFVVNLCFRVYYFQKGQEYAGEYEVYGLIGSLVLGITLFILFSLLYFFPTNKDLFSITGKRSEEFQRNASNVQATLHRKQIWYEPFMAKNVDRYYYIGSRFKFMQSRSSSHYDINVLNKVFSQNHINASVFEILLVLSYIAIGFFRDYEFFQVPASVSVMMILTIIIMLISALFSWFKSWTYPIIVAAFFLVNYLSTVTDLFQFKSYAFGLSYEEDKLVDYTKQSLIDLKYSDSVIKKDYANYINTLENWKKQTGKKKPKLILLNTSGGGLRSAMWTFRVLQELDSLTGKEFMKNIQMITGASGGMVGAAYYRDLMIMEKEDDITTRTSGKYLINISKDLLNRLSFSISTNDMFFRFQKVEINNFKYSKDRGYAFEQALVSNLDGAFSRTLGEYEAYERSGEFPTMIFTPTIVNDGRRLLVSSQHHGYLQATDKLDERVGLNPQMENIEYLKYFKKNNPKEVSFTSVLRMSSTFPYIMPMITMPTDPGMQVMDAGIRDNYGSKITVRYLIALRNWIKENTSGVIVLKIRDTKKTLVGETFENIGLFDRLLLPFGNMYGNFPRVQDFNQDELFSTAIRSMNYPIEVVTFNLRENFNDKISLSWHLTKKEKEKIINAIHSEENHASLERLLSILKMDVIQKDTK
ncbi:patatin-like phospholipase family protein [Brumimicrobium glaciale]|uniref:Patatin-like phospholipase family protein n=1 Tax=Brumimicrobium glaciale TaxID=200475 RepID=A0A4Q4KN12_9FLAO|nr:patatin-like phospholipase family protein [Brumimicrobium glaciale]RYM34765.1 patatin-like phospholipase family protein [Brumimicrobium glaciale]